MSAGERIVPEK